ncbi:MAG: hypothetical protein ACO2OR_05620 [Desulfurococcaceae archaeon]
MKREAGKDRAHALLNYCKLEASVVEEGLLKCYFIKRARGEYSLLELK